MILETLLLSELLKVQNRININISEAMCCLNLLISKNSETALQWKLGGVSKEIEKLSNEYELNLMVRISEDS